MELTRRTTPSPTPWAPSSRTILYTEIIAALAGSASTSLAGQWMAFYLALVLAPITVWLLYAARARVDGKPLPLSWRSWPILEMVFSLIAFAVWAAARPGSPLQEMKEYSPALAGIAVLVVTFLLGLIAPIFKRTIKVAP
jgi:RsiW-degrading membrane proteinase PrsW (M82 family)